MTVSHLALVATPEYVSAARRSALAQDEEARSARIRQGEADLGRAVASAALRISLERSATASERKGQ